MTAQLTRRELLPTAAALAGAAVVAAPAAAQGLSDAPGTTLEPGVHRVGANTVIKGDLLIKPGATIDVAAGCTLTLLGGLIAPITPIFTGAGLIDLNRSRLAWAHPEWWGAAPGDPARDSLPALRACLRAHPAMQLLAGDYYLSDTLVIDRPFSRVTGAGFRGTQDRQGTRLIVTSGSADVLRAGPAAKPPTVNDFAQNIEIRALALCRSQPVEHKNGTAPAGLRAQFLLFALFEQVSAFEHGDAFVARGLVRSTMRDCIAFRSLPGRRAGQPYRGFLLDGTGEIGLAGGNASLYLTACNATIGGAPAVADGVGLLAQGAFADSFVIDFEATALETGIRIDGTADALGGGGRNGHVNLHLRMPIIDQCGRIGIDVRDTSAHALIDIAEPYVAVSPTAEAAIRFERMRGSASVAGGQLVGGTNISAGGQAVGLLARDSCGLQVHGLKIVEHAKPVRLERCSGFALHLSVLNPASRPGGAGVALGDCDSGVVAPLLAGGPGAFAAGIGVDGRHAHLRIDVTGIASAAVGGPANRARVAGRPAPVPFRDANLAIEGA